MELKDKLTIGVGKLVLLKGQCYMNIADELGISEMSLKQIEYLKSLDKYCGMTTSRMAELLNLSKPTVTEMIKKFIKMDCVYKQSCASDGRVYYLKLTERGQRIVDLALLTNDVLVNKLMEVLDEKDIITLTNILMKIE